MPEQPRPSTVILDLRDERGRFFTQVRLDASTFLALDLHAKLRGITFPELLHDAILQYAQREAERAL